MTAGLYNFTIEQGTTFRRTFTWTTGTPPTPVDLTGATCRMQIRKSKSKTSALLSDVSAYLSLTPAEGKVSLEIPSTITDNYTFDNGYYSLRVDRTNDKQRLVEGVITISKETTV